MTKEIKTFDITEYAKKAREAFSRMEQTQQPGQLVSGGKIDVLRHIKADIKTLMGKGYTVQQIAEALKNDDVFSILPKTITEVLKGENKTAVVRKTRRTAPTTTSATAKATTQTTAPATNTQQSGGKGTFQIKPDTPDDEL